MRLQEVLHQREAEITILESSLKEKERMPSSSPLPMTAEERLEAVDIDSHLSPKTMNKFDEIRRSMALPNGHAEPKEESIPDSDASLQRLNELMLYDSVLTCVALKLIHLITTGPWLRKNLNIVK